MQRLQKRCRNFKRDAEIAKKHTGDTFNTCYDVYFYCPIYCSLFIYFITAFDNI